VQGVVDCCGDAELRGRISSAAAKRILFKIFFLCVSTASLKIASGLLGPVFRRAEVRKDLLGRIIHRVKGGKHGLVEDASDEDASNCLAIKDDVTAAFKPPKIEMRSGIWPA
jgi:hypothetical protein